MRRAFLFLSTLVLASTTMLASCSNDVSGPRGPRTELEANRQKWQSRGSRDYTLTMSKLCFCIDVGPFNVTVANDSVVAATRTSDGKPAEHRYLPTVTKLFDFIEQAINEGAVEIRVTYDPDLGYPREVVYDLSTRLADEEVTYTLSNLVKKP